MPRASPDSTHAGFSAPGPSEGMRQVQDPARRRLHHRLRFLLALVAAYALIMTFAGCADRLLLHPSTDPIPVPGAIRERLTNPAGPALEVLTARTRAARGGEPEAFVLSFCGNAERAEWSVQRVAENWSRHPVEVWAVNYPGFGNSDGPARLSSIPATSLQAYDELRRRAKGRPIFLSGLSLGTTAALHVAANRPVAGLVLHNPPPMRTLILRRYGWWNLWLVAGPIALQVPRELDSLPNASRCTVPAVFVLAGRD